MRARSMPSRKQLTETPARSMPSRKQLTETPARSMPARKQLTETLVRSMPARKQLTETLVRSMPSRKQLTETPDCSTAPRTSAYGDARLLNGAEHRGCWGLLKANPRRIPHPCPRSQRKAGKGVFSLHLARKASRRAKVKNGASSVPQAGCRGHSPRRRYSDSPCTQERRRAKRAA